MGSSHCSKCGCETRKLQIGVTSDLVEIEPRFCRRCGNALSHPVVDSQDLEDGDEDDEEFSLYNFNDLKEIVKGIVPENYKDLMPGQLERYAVQTIWKRLTGIDPYPNIDTRERDPEYDRQMQIAIERGVPPAILLPAPASVMDKSLEPLAREYHLVWVNDLVVSHASWTPTEAEKLRETLAKSYYRLEPCDCDQVTYIADESNPNCLRKA